MTLLKKIEMEKNHI